MADKTLIEWTEATWNPVTGCTKVSAGCKHCYAERDWKRLSANPATRYHGRAFTDVQCHDDVSLLPLRWKKPRRIFVNSMSDLFHPDVPDSFIDELFSVMAGSPQHTFQILTKRPERMLDYMTRFSTEMAVRDGVKYWPEAKTMTWPLQNVWLGVSVEDQATADERIPLLLQTPAAVRWISAEPLLGPVDLLATPAGDILCRCGGCMEMTPETRLDWVVAGGESGASARPMHPGWVRSLRDQCAAAGVPFLFKQWGEWVPSSTLPPDTRLSYERWGWISENGGPADKMHDRPFADESAHHELMARVGKSAAGRLLDGVLHDGYPEGGAA